MVDFRRIMTMTSCFGNERITDLYATVSNVLLNTQNNHIVIAYNTDQISTDARYYLVMLQQLAHRTRNKLDVQMFSATVSLAQMYIRVLTGIDWFQQRTYWLSIDDDVLVPHDTLRLLGKASEYNLPLFLYGFYEVENKRGYGDWTPNTCSAHDLLKVVNDQSLKSLVHQLYVVPEALTLMSMPGQYSGSFMVRISDVLANAPLVKEMQEWPKGRRGVDVRICQNAHSIHWIACSTAFHTDKTGSDLDKKLWTDMGIAEEGSSYPIKYTSEGKKQ